MFWLTWLLSADVLVLVDHMYSVVPWRYMRSLPAVKLSFTSTAHNPLLRNVHAMVRHSPAAELASHGFQAVMQWLFVHTSYITETNYIYIYIYILYIHKGREIETTENAPSNTMRTCIVHGIRLPHPPSLRWLNLRSQYNIIAN